MAIFIAWLTVRKVPSLDIIEDMPAKEQAWRDVGWRQIILYTAYSNIMVFLLYFYMQYVRQVVEAGMGLFILFSQSILFEQVMTSMFLRKTVLTREQHWATIESRNCIPKVSGQFSIT